MSSLAATQSDGFYFPPEWRPEFGGLSKYQGSKGANQYQTHGIIRFELPFDAWCLKCGRHMSKGLRFNAKKDKAPEKYFTTQIWAFSMKCPCPTCDQNFVIKTDPENDTYNMVEGMRKMEQDFEPELNDSLITATTDEDRHLLATDPIFRLQHEKEDKRKALSAKEHLESLIDLQDSQREKDYDMNSLLRRGSRDKRKRAIFLLDEGKKRGLNIPMVEPNEADYTVAKSIKFQKSKISSFAMAERIKMASLQAQSVFSMRPKRKGETTEQYECKSKTQTSLTSNQISSSARKQRKMSAAMAKQAEHNINITGLKLCDRSQSQNLDVVTDIKFRNRPKPNDCVNTSDKISGVVPAVCALNMLSMYGDDDCGVNSS
jgi:coiled-coil domain-containing protein 130